MRLVLVGPTYPLRGGIAQYTTSLYESFKREHSVLLLSFEKQYPSLLFPGKTQEDQSKKPFRVPHEAPLSSFLPWTWKRTAQRALAYDPEVILFQWWHPAFSYAFADVVRRVKLHSNAVVLFLCHNIYSHEGLPLPLGRVFERRLIWRAFRRVDGFLVHSLPLAEKVRGFKPEAPVTHICHPTYDFYVDFDAEPTEALNAKPRLLFFGNIRPYKGVDVLLKALAVVQRSLDFEAVIAGEFYVEPRPLRELADELGVADRIRWDDRYIPNERVPDLFRSADLLVLPYQNASQSGVVPLAYAFDVPVVATDVGGLSEVVLEGRTGYLVPAEDPGLLAEAIIRYFKEDRKSEFQQNIRRFKKSLNWDQVVEGTIRLVDDILRRRTPSVGASARSHG